jgi:hypothetical protein
MCMVGYCKLRCVHQRRRWLQPQEVEGKARTCSEHSHLVQAPSQSKHTLNPELRTGGHRRHQRRSRCRGRLGVARRCCRRRQYVAAVCLCSAGAAIAAAACCDPLVDSRQGGLQQFKLSARLRLAHVVSTTSPVDRHIPSHPALNAQKGMQLYLKRLQGWVTASG